MERNGLEASKKLGVLLLGLVWLLSACGEVSVSGSENLDGQPAGTEDPTIIFLSIDPSTFSTSDTTPTISGATGNNADVVILYSNSSCSMELVRGSATAFGTSGLTATVSSNSVTQIYGKAFRSFGDFENQVASDCTYLVTYTHSSGGPDVPGIVLNTPATSPSNSDDTPTFDVDLETGATFESQVITTLTLHSDSACSSGALATLNNPTGTSVQITASAQAADSIVTYYVKADKGFGLSSCSLAHGTVGKRMVSYEYDPTPPSYPNIVLQSPASSPGADDTPAFTVTVDGGSNFTIADWSRIDLYASQDCSGSSIANNASLTGADTSVILTAGSSIGASGTYEFSVKATDDVGNTICSYAEGSSEADLDFETYELDTTPPAFPQIALNSPATSPNTDDTPTFVLTLEGAGNFVSTDMITLHETADCSDGAVATKTSVAADSTTITRASGMSEGTLVFRVKVTDLAGNSTCSDDDPDNDGEANDYATYEYDNTPPVYPTIALNTPSTSPGNDSTPAFEVGPETGSSAASDTFELFASTNCSGSALDTETGSAVTLYYPEVGGGDALSEGSYTFTVKVTDVAGNTVCSADDPDADGNGDDYVTYVYDNTPPDEPEIMIAIPGTSPSTDSTPSFTVSLEEDGNILSTDTVGIHSNDTCTNLVSASVSGEDDASLDIEITTAQAVDTTVNYYALVTDAAGNSTCSETHGTSGDGTSYAAHDYDNTPPPAPEIARKSGQGTPSNDEQPQFTVNLEGGDTFATHGVVEIKIFDQAACAGNEVGGDASLSSNYTNITRDTGTSEGTTSYSAQTIDDAGLTTCSSEHSTDSATEGVGYANHLYDNTSPTWTDSLSLSDTVYGSKTETPTFTYTSNASDPNSGSGIAGYEYAIDLKSGTCDSATPDVVDWTTAPASGNEISGLSLTYGNTYCFMMRAVDNVGFYSSVVSEEWEANLVVTVAARYSNATDWMDYVKSDSALSETFTSTNAACDATETNRVDCRHGGEYRKVEVTFESSCAGLGMTDNLSAFDWTCDDGGANVVFYGVLKSAKRLKDLIDFATPAFLDNYVTLTGCVDCSPNITSTAGAWWSNTVTELPDNSGGAGSFEILATSGTIYTLDSTRNTAGYGINASKVAIVIDSDAILEWDDSSATNSTYCGTSKSCVIGANSTNHFLWIEGALDADGASNPAHRGMNLYNNYFVRVPYLVITEALETGLYTFLLKYTTIGSISVNGDIGGIDRVTLKGVDFNNSTDVIVSELSTFDVGSVYNTSYGLNLPASNTSMVFGNITSTDDTGYGVVIIAENTNVTGTITVSGTSGQGLYVTGNSSTLGTINVSNIAKVGQRAINLSVSDSSFGPITVTGDTGDTLLSTGDSLYLSGSNNTFDDITISQTGDASADTAFTFTNGGGNIFNGDITVHNNTGKGLHVWSTSSASTFNGAITAYSNGGTGVTVTTSGHTFNESIASYSNGAGGVSVTSSNNIFNGDVLVYDNSGTASTGFGLSLSSTAASNEFSNVLSYGNYATAVNLGSTGIGNAIYGLSAFNNGCGVNVSSSGGVLSNFTIANNGKTVCSGNNHGLRIAASRNVFTNGSIIGSANNGVYIQSGIDNIFNAVTISNNASHGLVKRAGASLFANILVANNGGRGVQLTGADRTTFLNLATFDNSSHGIGEQSNASYGVGLHGFLKIGKAGSVDCSGIAASDFLTTTTCTSSGTNGSTDWKGIPYLMSANLIRDTSSPYTIASTFVGKVTTDDTVNSSDSSGTATYDVSLDWFGFQNDFRAWGRDGSAFPNSDNQGLCVSGDCRIWDMSLHRDDSVILNLSGNGTTENSSSYIKEGEDIAAIGGNDNGICESGESCLGNGNGVCESGELCTNSFEAGAPCPSEVDGDQYIDSVYLDKTSAHSKWNNAVPVVEIAGDGDGICETSEACEDDPVDSVCDDGEQCVQRFLKNAFEITGDSIGDDDGLCEADEACVYTPNVGAYQGHGPLGSCIYSANGGLTGITIYGYTFNGR
ncbi:right-handed parallel beta-helix repeat-containing protein [bacterium]|nr:right-handed parallel beta-helix repeat-containing protein [bacterium]